MPNCFRGADFLLPSQSDMQKWAVIACDQFTSDPAYWQRVRSFADNAESTLHMILPEAEIKQQNEDTVPRINRNMQKYLDEKIFSEYKNSYIYVERTLTSGAIRQGIVGVIDLEKYDYRPEAEAMVRATEKTVLERVPPRVNIRKDAPLEFSHVLLLCNDKKNSLIEQIGSRRDRMKKLYDFDLMENGGHIAGWLVDGENAELLTRAVTEYEKTDCYLVGDGNHSLLAAKTCYELLKQSDPDMDTALCPARYATVELENVYSPAVVFEPIFRVLTDTDAQKLISDLQAQGSDSGYPITYVCNDGQGSIRIDLRENEQPIGALQRLLDGWLAENSGEIDYVHEKEAVVSIGQKPDCVGFLLDAMEKDDLFPYILSGNLLSRKAFSLGHGTEKRYYLEGRKIR